MKDFSPQVVKRPMESAEIADLLRKGQIKKAMRKAHAAGVRIPQEDVDATATTMFRHGRAGELLSMIGEADVSLPFSTDDLLSRVFEAGDYHAFLKQVHRLRASAGREGQIRDALAEVEQHAPREAQDWRRKLGFDE